MGEQGVIFEEQAVLEMFTSVVNAKLVTVSVEHTAHGKTKPLNGCKRMVGALLLVV